MSTTTATVLLLILAVAGPLVAVRQMQQAERNRRRLYVADMKVAHQAWKSADIGQLGELLDRHVPQHGQNDLRGFEWFYLWGQWKSTQATPNSPLRIAGTRTAFSPDGKLLVTVERRGIKLWRGDDFPRSTLGTGYLVKGVAFSSDGQWLATGDWNGALKLWQRAADNEFDMLSEPRVILSEDDQVHYDYLSFSPDGKLLATNRRR